MFVSEYAERKNTDEFKKTIQFNLTSKTKIYVMYRCLPFFLLYFIIILLIMIIILIIKYIIIIYYLLL